MQAAILVQNLSSLFLKEFYKKLKYSYAPGLEDVDFVDDLDVNNFVKEIRSLYEAKGYRGFFQNSVQGSLWCQCICN